MPEETELDGKYTDYECLPFKLLNFKANKNEDVDNKVIKWSENKNKFQLYNYWMNVRTMDPPYKKY